MMGEGLADRLARHGRWVETLGAEGEQLVLQDRDLSALALSGAALSQAILPGCRFDGAQLARADLYGANLSGCSFQGAHMREILLAKATLDDADLRGAVLTGAQALRASFLRASLVGAALEGADLRRALLDHADLAGARLDGAKLEKASLTDARLDDASLRGASLTDVRYDWITVGGQRLEGGEARAWLARAASGARTGLPGSPAGGRESTTLYLPNFDLHARLLAYDPATGAREELFRASLPSGRQEDLGFYVSADTAVVGVYASPEGPIVFRDGDRYRLADCRVEVTLAAERGAFTLFEGAAARIHVEYRRTPYKHFDAWSDEEEFVDFYLWLRRAAREPGFFARYTRS